MNTPLTDVIKRLKETREKDRKNAAQTFAAAANLVDIAEGAVSTTTSLIQEFSSKPELQGSDNRSDFYRLLNEKWHRLRSETDELLIACVSDEDIHRVLLREQLLGKIQERLNSLDKAKEFVNLESKLDQDKLDLKHLNNLSKSQLISIAKRLNLKGYSNLNKVNLINLISKKG